MPHNYDVWTLEESQLLIQLRSKNTSYKIIVQRFEEAGFTRSQDALRAKARFLALSVGRKQRSIPLTSIANMRRVCTYMTDDMYGALIQYAQHSSINIAEVLRRLVLDKLIEHMQSLDPSVTDYDLLNFLIGIKTHQNDQHRLALQYRVTRNQQLRTLDPVSIPLESDSSQHSIVYITTTADDIQAQLLQDSLDRTETEINEARFALARIEQDREIVASKEPLMTPKEMRRKRGERGPDKKPRARVKKIMESHVNNDERIAEKPNLEEEVRVNEQRDKGAWPTREEREAARRRQEEAKKPRFRYTIENGRAVRRRIRD